MIDISQATSMLTSMGVSNNVALRAAERTAQSFANADPLTFLKELRTTLAELSKETAQTGSVETAPAISGSSTYQATATINRSDTPSDYASSSAKTDNAPTVAAPFSNLEEFKTWERGLGDTFAEDYEPPDYVRVATLTLSGGNDTVVARYMFFKNHPEFAADYASIRSGNLSKFPTDGSTLVKSDLSKMSPETAAYYKNNPAELRAAEGFNMDPTLAKMRMAGEIDAPTGGVNITEWLMDNKWTTDGIVPQNNRLAFAQSDYIGLDGKGAGTYRLGKYDSTGNIVNYDGLVYDPVTGEVKA